LKHDRQNDITKILANIMTRALANDHNHFVTNDASCPTINLQTSETRPIKRHNLIKRQAECAAMTRQINFIAKKNKVGNRDGRQNKWTLFFSLLHFATIPD
jgi:hypothetical protein